MTNIHLSGPEKFVILVLLVLGSVALVAVPLSAGYDEETHFIRAWEMAHLYFVPNEQLGARLPFPAIYWDLSYRRQPLVEAVEPGFWSKYGSLSLDSHDYVYANVETRSVYFPVLLLPQALTLRYVGLSLQLPALPVYYACRLAGLLSYLILCWLAVRLIPYAKWLMAILIVSPMALFQAATISADTISNGLGFFFLGATLAIVAGGDITWKRWFALLGLVALLFVAKVNLIFLAILPFLIIRPARFRMKSGFVLLAAASLTLLLIEVGGWNILAYSKFTRALEGANPREQLLFIATNPLVFVQIIARDLWVNTPAYMRGWVGVYGYDYWPVPGLTYLLYPLAVILITLRGNGSARAATEWSPERRTRFVLVALFIAGFILTIASLYVAFTPVKSPQVAGVQGRYFTVVMPLLFLALFGLTDRYDAVHPREPAAVASSPMTSAESTRPAGALPIRIPTSVPVGMALAALALYVLGLLLSYHVLCGSEYYRWDLCYQPEYKNWAPGAISSAPISPALTLQQEIVPVCGGMTQLSVWVNSSGTDAGGTTTLLLHSPTEQKDVFQQTFGNADVPRDGWLTIHFSPEWQSQGQLYQLTLRGSSPGGIQVGYSAKSEYLAGKLFENGTAVSQDLLFQYGCVAGLQKLWLGRP